MLKLLSRIKDGLHDKGIELINSQIDGDAIKLCCSVNGGKCPLLNAYIIPDGDDYNFYTLDNNGNKSNECRVCESDIINKLDEVANPNLDRDSGPKVDDTRTDLVTITMEDGQTDTKRVPHNTYNNARYAYSKKFSRMGTITNIKEA
jgi:hypothetical protein